MFDLKRVNQNRGGYIPAEDLYLTKDKEVVGGDHPGKQTLIARAGQTIDVERAIELGLASPDPQSSMTKHKMVTGPTSSTPVSGVPQTDTPKTATDPQTGTGTSPDPATSTTPKP